jgi:hypothetical protein
MKALEDQKGELFCKELQLLGYRVFYKKIKSEGEKLEEKGATSFLSKV